MNTENKKQIILTDKNIKELAYLAGLMDADGSIMAQFVPKPKYRTKWFIKITIKIKQSSRRRQYIIDQKNKIGVGVIVPVVDSGSQFMSYELNEVAAIKQLLTLLLPYLEAKLPQAQLALELLEKRDAMDNDKELFFEVVDLAEKISNLNDEGRPRIWTGAVVKASFEPFANLGAYAVASKLKNFNRALWEECELNPALVLAKDKVNPELQLITKIQDNIDFSEGPLNFVDESN